MRLSNVSLRNSLLALTVAAGALVATGASADPGHGRGHWKDNDRRGGYESRGGDYRYRSGGGGEVRYRSGGGDWNRSGTRVRVDARWGNGGGYGYGYRGGYGGRVYVRSRPVYVQPAPRVVYAEPSRVYVRCAPRFVTYRPHRVIVVRPAPYARIGLNFGRIGIRAILGGGRSWNDCDYGCNFCDAHFSSYGAYERHVESCAYRPRDCEIQCRNWDNAGYDEWRGNDQGQCEDRYGQDSRSYDDRSYNDDRRYDDDDQGYDDRSYDEDDDN